MSYSFTLLLLLCLYLVDLATFLAAVGTLFPAEEGLFSKLWQYKIFLSLNYYLIYIVTITSLSFCIYYPNLHSAPLMLDKYNKTREERPHRLDVSEHTGFQYPLCYHSAPSHPPLVHPHSSTLPQTPVSPALSALWGICISNRANSHSTVQRASPSHLPLVSERSLLLLPLLRRLLLPRQGSAAVQEHDSRECWPPHFNLPKLF